MGLAESREATIPTEDSNSPLKRSSNNKLVTVNFMNIERKMEFELSMNNISFETFSKEFEKAINLPPDAQTSYFTANSLTETPEIIEKEYIICNINKEIGFELKKRGSIAKIVDVTLTVIEDRQVHTINRKTYNFFPLKYFMMNLTEPDRQFRVFDSTDTQFKDPLNLNLSLLDCKINDEEVILILYYITDKDIVRVNIQDHQANFKFDVDRFMKISELTELYNTLTKRFNVICDLTTRTKLYEEYTLEKFLEGKKSISFHGKPFDVYYKRILEVPRVNPLEKEEVKTNLLDLPD